MPRLPRLTLTRPVMKIIDRAVREVLGPRKNHNFLYEKSLSSIASKISPNVIVTVSPGGEPGGAVDVTSAWMWGVSAWGGTDTF